MTSRTAEVPNVAAALTIDPRPSPKNQRRHSTPLSPRKNLVAPLRSPQAAFRNTRNSLGASPKGIDHMPPASPPITGGSFRTPMSPRLNGKPIVETQKIAEQTAQEERQRIKDMEKEEAKMTADELRLILKQERRRMLEFAVDLAKLRSNAAQIQAESEMHEERAVNGLMRKLDTLKGEKSKIMVELEREEDLVTNTIKKLEKLRKEKADLQKTIDSEKAEQDQLEKKAAEANKGAEEAPSSAPTTDSKPNANLVSLTEDQEEEGEDDPNWYIENLPDPALGSGCDT